MSLTLVSFTQPNFIKFITVENDVKCPVRDNLKTKFNGIFHEDPDPLTQPPYESPKRNFKVGW